MKRSSFLRVSPTEARLTVPVLKPRKCKQCKETYQPFRPMQAACGPQCAQGIAAKKKALEQAKERRSEAKADRVKREEMKSLSQLANEAQTHVNRYCRYRDIHAGLGCISCGAVFRTGEKWDGGHMRSRGASPNTRFITWAIRLQCTHCNMHKGGNAAEMYRRMMLLVGQEKLDWLYSQNTPAKFSRDYLIRLKQVFRKRADKLYLKLNK